MEECTIREHDPLKKLHLALGIRDCLAQLPGAKTDLDPFPHVSRIPQGLKMVGPLILFATTWKLGCTMGMKMNGMQSSFTQPHMHHLTWGKRHNPESPPDRHELLGWACGRDVS